MLCLSVAVGLAQVAYGHFPREGQEEEIARCLEVTAGAAGSPCYEIHGQAAVKLAHFLPLHATEVLLLLAWASGPSRQGQRLVRAAAAACWSLSLLGLWLTARGVDIRRPRSVVPVVVEVLSLGSIALVFLLAYVAPLAEKQKGDKTVDRDSCAGNRAVGG